MSTLKILKEIEQRVRTSKPYYDWSSRNKSNRCIKCNSPDRLECHHIIDLYHIILGLWKFYGDEESVYQHAISIHANDRCESATLCDTCHGIAHPGRSIQTQKQVINVDMWSVLPRNLSLPLSHSKKHKQSGSIGYIGFQTLLGIGWHILNGNIDARIISFNRRRFAELIGKKPCSSFNTSLNKALDDLRSIEILVATHQSGDNIELHLSKEYLESISINPWFLPMSDVKIGNMGSLVMSWFLSMQSNRMHYKISVAKLIPKLGISPKPKSRVSKTILNSCSKIPWAKVGISDGMCLFTIRKRGATPIFSLRQILQDSLESRK